MGFTAQTQPWLKRNQGGKGEAVLLVHGIGNAKPGSYDFLIPKIRAGLGPNADKIPIYILYYDFINDWFREKTQLEKTLGDCEDWIQHRLAGEYGDAFNQVVAEVLADVIWPVLSLAARDAVQQAFAQQLQRMVMDGMAAGFPPDFQNISILCHSLGCLHTYEMLHRCVNDASLHLHPTDDGVRFANVIYMASPVQLIRSVAGGLGPLVPQGLACLEPGGLACPVAQTPGGDPRTGVKNWVAIAGALDPVGGYFFRRRLPWAYMDVPEKLPFGGQKSLIDAQDWLSVQSEAELRLLLSQALAQRKAGEVPLNDPHSWGDYIVRHQNQLEAWICVG